MTDSASSPPPPIPLDPARSRPPDAQTAVIVGAAVVLVLYFGRSLLVPLAVAILLTFVLVPLVRRLRRLRLGRVPSVLLSVLVALGVLTGVFSVVGMQLVDLANNLPKYENNLVAKIRALRPEPAQGGLVERTSRVLEHLGREIRGATEAAEGAAGQAADAMREAAPLRVQVEPPPATPLAVLQEVGGPLLHPLASAGMVLIFTVFMLLQQEDLRDRLIRLTGAQDLKRTTEALDEAAKRVTRYLLMHLTLNLLYGIPVGIGLWLLGVPNGPLWGLLATVLRFIPFLGPVIAACFPVALAVAVDPGWTLPLMTIGLVVAIELFSNNVLEPWLYGTSTGISSLAVVLAAIFWTSLWGPVGLLLATPLTVCLVVLGRHVPQLGFLEVALGNRPALPPPARIYQRLLARDPTEAAEIADDHSSTAEPPAAVYDRLLLGALRLAEQDRLRNALDEETLQTLLTGMGDVTGYFAEDSQAPSPPPSGGRILCVAGRSRLDEAAALLLADLLQRQGRRAEVVPCESVNSRQIAALDRGGVDLVVLTYLSTGSGRHAQRLLRRLRRRIGPDVPMLLGLWDGATPPFLPPPDGPEQRVTSLPDALAAVARLRPPSAGKEAEGQAEDQPGRTAPAA